jgi:excisionase family DNA binding protein
LTFADRNGKTEQGEEMPKATAPETIDRDWFTVQQAAAYLQVSTRTIARYIDRGTLTASQLVPGGTVRISTISIEKVLEAAKK